MKIFKHYKLKKKQKIEQKINNIILFNKWKIQCYKEYPEKIKPPIKEFSDSTGMARFYPKDTWEYFKKYNVNKNLFDKQLQYYDIAMDEYDKLEKRLKQKKLNEEERERINLYKKAILELKKEGKI
ncbi:hypothetical protein ACFHWD_04435 [Clostridium sp. MT-14]|jgi:membrane-associated HD superfamily phosphohydrolase|uniref:hypothetical protein n=1 Tax=Clostridium sp. MT-14 TaxID=3348360 RepID=UPI0035F4E5D1